MSWTRRDWLKTSGAASAALAGAPLFGAVEEWFQPARQTMPGMETLVTACHVCESQCGMIAHLQDGVARFLDGLPADQHGGGALCAKGKSGLGFLYDPDRLKYPMVRTNPRKGIDEDPGWARISWPEALDTIAQRFQAVIDQHGPDALLFLTKPGPDVWMRYINAIGAINRVDHLDECFLTDKVVSRWTVGGKTFTNDFENAGFILLFGWDLVAKNKIVHARRIPIARDNGAKIVVFNPYHSTTAKFADEWYPIRPGTDLAVALAMINVIVGENLYNREFVDSFTNFGQFESQIRTHFSQYTPEWAESVSEVPADAIARLAREFATMGPAIVPAHKKTLCGNYANGSQMSFAIMVLNILAGTIDRPGGRYFPRTIPIPSVDKVFPPPEYPKKTGVRVDGRDQLPLVNGSGNGLFLTLADGMLEKHPGHIKAAFVNGYTALGFPEPLKMMEALESVEFTVVMDVLPTDTIQAADIVLPHVSYLEVNQLTSRVMAAKYPQVLARQALTKPLFESKGVGFVALELGKRMVPDYFKKENGEFFTLPELLDEQVMRAGLGESWAAFKAQGVFSDEKPFTPKTTFNLPDGKCQVYVPQFEANGYDPLPAWTPKRDEPDDQYPYYFVTFIPGVHKRNSTQNNAILNELMGTNSVLMHPSLAAEHGITEGRLVRVWSRVGSIQLPAQFTERLRPDCVMVAHGFGHRSRLLSKAGGRGERDGDLIPASSIEEVIALKNFAGAGCIMDAVCNVEPVG